MMGLDVGGWKRKETGKRENDGSWKMDGRVYALRELNDMATKGFLVKKGKGRSVHYTLVSD